MPRGRDHSAVRLDEHLANENDPWMKAFGVTNEAALLGAAYGAAQEFQQSDWSDPKQRALAAHEALKLDSLDVSLTKAFDAFGFNHRNPFHWRKLMAYFCDVHFGRGDRRRRGPSKRWSDDKLCQLLSDFDQVRSGYKLVPGSKISDLEVCKRLKNHPVLGTTYIGSAAETVLRNLQRARNPNQNGRLSVIVSNALVPILAAAAQKGDKVLGQKLEQLIRSTGLDPAIKVLSQQWRKKSKEVGPRKRRPGRDLFSILSGSDGTEADLIASLRRAGLGY